MKCEQDYCIYHRDNECVIDEIRINSLGMCDECIIVSFDVMVLEENKRRQLEDIERRCT